MNHKHELTGFKSAEEFAEEFGNLRYDSMVEYLDALSSKFKRDAAADCQRKRYKLSSQLFTAAGIVVMLSLTIRKARNICKPFMN